MNSPKSRYPFAPIKDGAFLFVTDQGCFYIVDLSGSNRFSNDPLLHNEGEIFEISFSRDGDGGGYDESIGQTILYILGTNMAAKGDTCIYYYVCDTTDGDGKLRARLFDKWYLSLKRELPHLEKHNYIVPGFEGDKYDVSLFIFSNHPKHDEYLKEFANSLDDNFSKANY